MKQKSIKVSDEFFEAVQKHKAMIDSKSWTEALVDLASEGINLCYGRWPRTLGQWGGRRGDGDS